MINKINYYLTHEEERIRIANNGKKRIEKEYTYKIQLNKIFETVFHEIHNAQERRKI